MKIALVHTADFGGGAERSVVSLHKQLRSAGHDCTLYVGRKTSSESDIVEIPYVRGIPGLRRTARAIERRFGLQDIYNPSFRNLIRLIPSETDVVHFNSLWGAAGYADLGVLPAITRRFPSLVTMREAWLLTGHCACFFECDRWKQGCGQCPDLARAPAIERDGTASNWRRKHRLFGRSPIRVIAISNWLARRARESPILKHLPIETVYNGIDTEVFRDVDPSVRRNLRRKFGVGEDQIAILVAGQTVEGINEDIAQEWVTAINEISDDRIVVMIIGHSAQRVSQGVSAPSICVPFRATPEEMAECFHAADFTVVTSAFEAFGRIAAESQACRTPVVSFDTGGLPEVVVDHEGGLLVPRHDIAALRNAIERMLREAELRKQLGVQGQVAIHQRFSDSLIAENYLRQYRGEIAARNVA
ncbi:MAG: glycosyltransferase [Planctomycetota bacterium]